MARTDKPEECYFKHVYEIVTGCPYRRLSPEAARVWQFVNKTLEKSESVNEKTKVKKVSYSLSIERFNWACDLHNVDNTDRLEALSYCLAAAEAATDAPEMSIREDRKRLWGRR